MDRNISLCLELSMLYFLSLIYKFEIKYLLSKETMFYLLRHNIAIKFSLEILENFFTSYYIRRL